jgi:Glycosyl transferase family 2
LERGPQIAVVVPTYGRPLRLRWLLNALEEQTLDRSSFEVIVGHDALDRQAAEVLARHPLAEDGTLRPVAAGPGEHRPARLRNLAWRSARAPLVAFTDDDCRPAEGWLERMLAAAGRSPGAVLQGTTMPDPREDAEQRSPWPHSQTIEPPEPWGQTCNIAYARALLERVGGFDESYPGPAGEDTDLALRARAAGAGYEAAPEAVVYHAVHGASLPRRVRSTWRWSILPALPRRHPEVRRHYTLGVFWRPAHIWLLLAGAGLMLSRRRAPALLLALPWAMDAAPSYGTGPRGRIRSGLELPGRFAIDAAELFALAWGSVKHRSLLL